MKKFLILLSVSFILLQISCNSDSCEQTPIANSVDVYVTGHKSYNAYYWKNNQEIILSEGGGSQADTLFVSNETVHVFGKRVSDNWNTQHLYWKNNILTNLTEALSTPSQMVREITGYDVVGDDVYCVGYTKNPIIAA